MKRAIAFPAALLCGLLLTACPAPRPGNETGEVDDYRPDPIDRNAIAERIRRDETRQVEAWASRDLDRIAGYYAANATLVVPCLPRITGTARIRAHIAALLEDRNLELRFDSDRVDVAASGDLAYSVGTYSMRRTDPATGRALTESGNYLTTYRQRRDGAWKAVDDIAVSSGAATY